MDDPFYDKLVNNTSIAQASSELDNQSMIPDFEQIIEGLKHDRFIGDHLGLPIQDHRVNSNSLDNPTVISNIDTIRKKITYPSTLLGKNHLLKRKIRRLAAQLKMEQQKLATIHNQFQHQVQKTLLEYLKSKRKVRQPTNKPHKRSQT